MHCVLIIASSEKNRNSQSLNYAIETRGLRYLKIYLVKSIGPAAAGPAGPVPAPLNEYALHDDRVCDSNLLRTCQLGSEIREIKIP